MEKSPKQNLPPLWTRDFTILTVGSVVSLFGDALAAFAISLFVLDYTQSPVYYALYVFLFTLPQLAAPQPQALWGRKHAAPLPLSTHEMAGEKRGSTP